MNHSRKKRGLSPTAITAIIMIIISMALLLCSFSAAPTEATNTEVTTHAAKDLASEVVGQSQLETAPTPLPAPAPIMPDRTQPLYAIYKDKSPIYVPTEWQWYIRDLSWQYGVNEAWIYGTILAESTFSPKAKNGGCLGLGQINKFWIRGANINHFTADYRQRDLLNPYHNILTIVEMACYARDSYGINMYSESGLRDLSYWWNTGRYVKNVNWKYSHHVLNFANELVLLQTY